ncbi:MAG: Cd(II)/Pb(II)-responsive transcriptional regulator [Deltaproteobacteria bacterium]|nr:MAG: Cd(II)/Pb(II)-responsive transcriptional regulator [Deltaproteobacteria bacterium]
MKIGELAKQTGCSVETIRFYEKEEILTPPQRSAENNYRIYNRNHVEQLLFIRRCRSLDMSLDEIKRLLHLRSTPQEDCTEVSDLLDTHINQIDEHLSDLEHLKQQLESLRQRCNGAHSAEQCGILQELNSTKTTDS